MSNYGFSTYKDFDRACGDFIRMLPDCKTVEEVDGLEKGLGLAYLNFERATPAEQILAEGRLKFLYGRSILRTVQIERLERETQDDEVLS